VIFCGKKEKVELESNLLELESTDAMETTTPFIFVQSPIPTASNESLPTSVASVEEKSQPQQDDSSENSEISSLPNSKKLVLLEVNVKNW